jgi:hypothetical protein
LVLDFRIQPGSESQSTRLRVGYRVLSDHQFRRLSRSIRIRSDIKQIMGWNHCLLRRSLLNQTRRLSSCKSRDYRTSLRRGLPVNCWGNFIPSPSRTPATHAACLFRGGCRSISVFLCRRATPAYLAMVWKRGSWNRKKTNVCKCVVPGPATAYCVLDYLAIDLKQVEARTWCRCGSKGMAPHGADNEERRTI